MSYSKYTRKLSPDWNISHPEVSVLGRPKRCENMPTVQTTKLSAAIAIQREAPNRKTALGTPGPWWVRLSASLDGVKGRSL